MEMKMDAEQIHTDRLVAKTKKTYSKPTINKVQMMAEEADLGLCKYTDAATGAVCAPDMACLFAARS